MSKQNDCTSGGSRIFERGMRIKTDARARTKARRRRNFFTPTLLHVSLAHFQKKKIVVDVKEFYRDEHRFYMIVLQIKGYYDF